MSKVLNIFKLEIHFTRNLRRISKLQRFITNSFSNIFANHDFNFQRICEEFPKFGNVIFLYSVKVSAQKPSQVVPMLVASLILGEVHCKIHHRHFLSSVNSATRSQSNSQRDAVNLHVNEAKASNSRISLEVSCSSLQNAEPLLSCSHFALYVFYVYNNMDACMAYCINIFK